MKLLESYNEGIGSSATSEVDRVALTFSLTDWLIFAFWFPHRKKSGTRKDQNQREEVREEANLQADDDDMSIFPSLPPLPLL